MLRMRKTKPFDITYIWALRKWLLSGLGNEGAGEVGALVSGSRLANGTSAD